MAMILKNPLLIPTFIGMPTKFDEFFKSMGIKGQEIADLLGMHKQYWSQKKKNPKGLTVQELYKICQHFDIKPAKLIKIIMEESVEQNKELKEL